MNAEQVKSFNELCEIYHRIDCDRKADAAVITLLMSLLGYALVGDMPQTVQGSINAFRTIGHQERYNFTMTAIANLMECPSANLDLRDLFDRLVTRVEPLTDGVGHSVLQHGMLSFGRYNCTSLASLIFSETLKR